MAAPFTRAGLQPNDDDYYVILDVDFNATTEQIKAAYHDLARRFHPDKNNRDDRSRREAAVIFDKIRTAYEVLSNPERRRIYDAVGAEGLKHREWMIVSRHMTNDDIRKEFMRAQKEDLERKNSKIVGPAASFTLSLDASNVYKFKRLFIREESEIDEEDDEEDEVYQAESLLEAIPTITYMSASSGVNQRITPEHSVRLSGDITARNGRGEGIVSTGYEYKYSSATKFGLHAQLGRTPSLSEILYATVAHKLDKKTSVLLRVSSASVSGTLVHHIRDNLIGKVTYRAGKKSDSAKVGLIYINETLLLRMTTSYKMTSHNQYISIEAAHQFNSNQSEVHASVTVGLDAGVEVEYGCETKISRLNTVKAALSFGLDSGVTLKLGYVRASHEFIMPIYLSDEMGTSVIFYGTMAPLIAYYIFDCLRSKEQEGSE